MALNMGGNLVSFAVVAAIFVAYKRCIACKSHLHLSWLDCESDAIRELKKNHTKQLYLEALREFQTETQRNEINGTIFGSSRNWANRFVVFLIFVSYC